MIKSINNANVSQNGIIELSDKALQEQAILNSSIVKNTLNIYRSSGEKYIFSQLGNGYFSY